LDGGGGADLVRYDDAVSGVTVDLGAGAGAGGASGDLYISIESAVGSNFSDVLLGDAGDNALYGLTGDDLISGGAGNDQLAGGEGNDHLYGGVGADWIDGGAGFDLARFDGEAAGVVIDLQNGVTGTGDHLVAIEGLVTTNQADSLWGDGGANVIYAMGGDDRIVGGAGDDRLYGGAGADVFAFDASSGVDWIGDFNTGAGHDVIAIQKNVNGSGIVDFATLATRAHDSQSGLVVDLGGANELHLTGVTLADLNAGLFLFY
jgi:serralysin